MDALLQLSATALARRIREREITSSEVVEAHIRAAERVDPTLNAIVWDRYREARAEALAADARIADGADDLPPLHGVPCTIKEAFAVTGQPQTGGLYARRHHISVQDATGVARLRAAGAIVIAGTNVSELCMWLESNNTVYGRTNNPYDPARTVGGSSGGEGAIVASGASPFGLGSDIAGSIRFPAFFNGVFGHKPTGGLVPGTGQFPIAEKEALRYLVSGPITRRAEDLRPLLRILAGPDGQDEGCRSFELGDPADVELSGLRVLDNPDNGLLRVHPELKAAQRRAAEHLADRGAHVEQGRVGLLKRSMEIWSAMMGEVDGTSFEQLMGAGRGFQPVRELARWAVGRSHHTLPGIGLAALEGLTKVIPGVGQRYIELGAALKEQLVERIGPNGVMLYPTYTVPAPLHNRPLLPPTNWAYTVIMNVAELPSTQVPLGLGSEGLPLGLQVVGIHGNDHLTIAVAQELERAFGGWDPPRHLYR